MFCFPNRLPSEYRNIPFDLGICCTLDFLSSVLLSVVSVTHGRPGHEADASSEGQEQPDAMPPRLHHSLSFTSDHTGILPSHTIARRQVSSEQ